MRTHRREKVMSRRFTRGLSIYTLIVLLLLAAGLTAFWFFIRDYEQTRPATVVTRYLEGLNGDYLAGHASDALDTLDSRVQSREESLARISEIVRGASSARVPGGPEDVRTYVLRGENGQVFETITLTASGKSLFGLTTWEISGEAFDFAPFCGQTELTVPAGWSVSVGGVPLDSGFAADERVPYAAMEDLYSTQSLSFLPCMVTYRTGNYIGELPVELTDAKGQSVAPENWNEDYYTDNCSPAEKEEIKAFIPEFVSRYVNFMGSHFEGLIYYNYSLLLEMVLPGSDLESRLAQVTGLGFSWSIDELDDWKINKMMSLGDGYYFCDVTYYVLTQGHRDFVTTTNNAKIIMLMTEDGLKACNRISY